MEDAALWLTYHYVWPTLALTVPAFRRLTGSLRPATRPSVATFFAQVFRGNDAHIDERSAMLRSRSTDGDALLA